MLDRISIIPNYSIFKGTGRYHLKHTEKYFLYDLTKYFKEVELAYFVTTEKVAYHSESIDDGNAIKVKSFATVKGSQNRLTKCFSYLIFFLRATFFCLKRRFVYIFIPNTPILLLAPILLLFKRRKYALYLRGDLFIFNKISLSIYRLLLKNACFVICTGDFYTSYSRRLNKHSFEAVPTILFSKGDLFFKDFSVHHPKVVLYFTGINRNKGIFDLLEAMESVFAKCNDVILKIGGTGLVSGIDELLQNISGSKYADRIQYLGLVQDKEETIAHYKAADIFVSLSHHEGFPRVQLEAMTFSAPILCTDIRANEIIMVDYQNCRKCKPGDIKGIERIVLEMLCDDALRKKLSIGSFQTMQKKYEYYNTYVCHANQLHTYAKMYYS